MEITNKFADIVDEFEMIKDSIPNLSSSSLHKLAHQYNSVIATRIDEMYALMDRYPMSIEERQFHMCRIERLDTIILHFAMAIDDRIRMVA